jgi:hypothetical protein
MNMMVERGTPTGAWYWKGLSTRNLAFKDRCVLPCINHLKNTVQQYIAEMHP